ncbi:Fc.00g083420.m01.CDS01 [Cosmosporella sp. VM-42]
MAICSICTTAIAALYPKQSELEPTRITTATYPPYDSAASRRCWICAKHAEFLKGCYAGVFQQWLKNPLTSVFRCDLASPVKDQDAHGESNQAGQSLPADSLGRRKLRVNNMFIWRCVGDDPGGSQIDLCFLKCGEIRDPTPSFRYWGSAPIHFQQIRDWINECQRDHTACGSHHTQDWYPTRLLDLSLGEARINLTVTEETKPTGSYMTLSHRWGNFQYDKLTSDSIDRFKSSIDTSSLPQVFQDAVAVTRTLKIRYLWIDSLCIKQDKECGDWEIEALKMGEVYTHSYLNLSASYAANEVDNPPLFRPESWDNIRPAKLGLEGDSPLQQDFVLDGDIWRDEVLESPLMERGWVFQERLLAPRVLHFGMRQMAWECNGSCALEMFPRSLPRCLEIFGKRQVHLSTMQPKHKTTLDEFRACWRQLVTRYSTCELTFRTDKLVALAGTAKMIEAQRGDRYIAGTFESIVREDLGWFLGDVRNTLTPIGATTSRAPSWSWLSLDGEICFYPEPFRSQSLTYFCRILQTPGPDSVGSSVFTARGSLRVEGMILPLQTIHWSVDEIKDFHIDGLHFQQGPSPENTRLDPDGSKVEVENLIARGELGFVPLYASELSIIAILVSGLSGSVTCRRVGAAQIQLAKIPHRSKGPHLDGWISVDQSPLAYHVVGVESYYRIRQRWERGVHDVFSLI